MSNSFDSHHTTARFWLLSGAILAGFSVVTGAFAAHGLDSWLIEKYPLTETRVIGGLTVPASYKYLQDFKTAAEYQMTHSLALIAVGLLVRRAGSRRDLTVAGWSFLSGILLFCGSLYVLVISGVRAWGAVTPIGGVLFLLGWTGLSIGIWRSSRAI